MRIHAAPEEVGRAGGVALIRLVMESYTVEILTSIANGSPLMGGARSARVVGAVRTARSGISASERSGN
jgi:hypothetical protein